MRPDELHVLLIGIDAYDGGGSLRGCVNDVDAIQGILLDRLAVSPERVTRLVSPRFGADHDTRIEGRIPTLAAITGELDRLAGDAVAPTDRVFVYYSGHGTQVVVEDSEGSRFPREALLPKDKVRGPENIVLADWELNAAMARIGARCRSATVVLDCCCSAGATRAPNFGRPRCHEPRGGRRSGDLGRQLPGRGGVPGEREGEGKPSSAAGRWAI